MTIRFAVACGLLLASALSIRAEDRLRLDVSPTVGFAPVNVTVRTTITRNPDNRAIQIAAESADFYRSSEIQLDGDRSPRTFIVEFRSVPGGRYQVSAMLIDVRGGRTSARREIVVRGAGEP